MMITFKNKKNHEIMEKKIIAKFDLNFLLHLAKKFQYYAYTESLERQNSLIKSDN